MCLSGGDGCGFVVIDRFFKNVLILELFMLSCSFPPTILFLLVTGQQSPLSLLH